MNIEKEPSNPEEKSTNMPSTLDVIRVDSRWAQVVASGVPGIQPGLIRYLDDNSRTYIDWKEYAYEPLGAFPAIGIGTSNVGNMIEKGLMKPDEYENVYWGRPQQDEHPELKSYVAVFGKYTKKQHPEAA